MNNAWTLTGFDTQNFQQYKVIYMIDKLCNYLGYKKLIIGYDNRFKSEKIAETLSLGLAKKLNVVLTDKPVNSSMLSLLVKDEQFDMSLYITGDYENWRTYGFKIKIDKGRNISFKEFKNAKKILNEFTPKNYTIDFAEKVRITNYDDYYLQELKKIIPSKKKLNYKIIFNAVNYCRPDITIKLFQHFNCHIKYFNACSIHNIDPDIFSEENVKESEKFLMDNKGDLLISITDGEMLYIRTHNWEYNNTEIALMLAEIQKDNIKKIICPENHVKLQNFAKINNIKCDIKEQPLLICNTPHTLTVTNSCIIDSNFSKSMDSHYIILKVLNYITDKNISIDDFYQSLKQKYEI